MSNTETVSPLRQRMIEDTAARKLNPHTQRSHISSCKRFAAWLKRSPDTQTADEVRRFQLHLVESGASICNRNRILTMATRLKARAMLTLEYGCGLRASEVVLPAGSPRTVSRTCVVNLPIAHFVNAVDHGE